MSDYASHASEQFNARLEATLKEIAAAVADALGDGLVALILGGGYGRGEGGVYVRDGHEEPYNDIDFTLVVKEGSRLDRQALNTISRDYARQLGIHVDFSRPLTRDDIRSWPRWLMWQDLLNGHIVLHGPADILSANAPAVLSQPLPPIEALRLLLNRGAGLLWARRILAGHEPEPDPDFVRRNYWKGALALGDTLLIAEKCHQTAYSGRDRRFVELAERDAGIAELDVAGLYEQALEFKFSPHLYAGEAITEAQLFALAERWGQVLLLTETRRMQRRFADVASYCNWTGIREPELSSLSCIPANLVRNARLHRLGIRYPREPLYQHIPRLLCANDPTAPQWKQASAVALEQWRIYN